MAEKTELTKEEQVQLQRDVAMTDIILRLTALEKILIEKNIISSEEFGKTLEIVLEEMNKIMKNAGFPDIAKMIHNKAN